MHAATRAHRPHRDARTQDDAAVAALMQRWRIAYVEDVWAVCDVLASELDSYRTAPDDDAKVVIIDGFGDLQRDVAEIGSTRHSHGAHPPYYPLAL